MRIRIPIYRQVFSKIKVILLICFCVFLFFKSNDSLAQTKNSHRNGAYLGGQKGWNVFKSRKKYSHIKNKKSKKKLSKQNNTNRKRSNFKRKKLSSYNKKNSHFKRNGKVNLKKTKLGKSGSLYSYNKKKNKKRKGKFPKSKSQLYSKATAYVSTGLVMTKGNDKYDENLDLIDVYANYKTSPHLTAGLNYNHTNQLSIGGEVKVFSLRSKEQNLDLKLNTFVLGGNLKYNFLPTSRPFSPYLSLGPSFSFTNFSKKDNNFERDFPQSQVNADANVDVGIVLQNDPGFTTKVIPLYGVKIAVGGDFKINTKLSAFVQADIDFSSARNKKLVLQYFDKNKANYIFYGVSFGVKYNLFQKSSLY